MIMDSEKQKMTVMMLNDSYSILNSITRIEVINAFREVTINSTN